MLDINDFSKKQVVVYMPTLGEKISYKNDNLVIKDADGKIKYQHTCYRIFMLMIIGDCSLTTGLIRRSKKFGFSICFMTYTFRYYSIIQNGLEGNNYLHKKQYEYNDIGIGRMLILNKIINQRCILSTIRRKSEFVKEGIIILDKYIDKIESATELSRDTLMGYEGNAARVYFARVFDNVNWQGRKPRIKFDYVNSLLDIGYTILFGFVEAILRVYDFDIYHGVLHTDFYMRKSLVCDLIEPFRPMIDLRVRKGINLGQFKEADFVKIKGQYQLQYKKSTSYSYAFMKDILDNKESIFLFLRNYYRAFMKGKKAEEFLMYDMSSGELFLSEEVGDKW